MYAFLSTRLRIPFNRAERFPFVLGINKYSFSPTPENFINPLGEKYLKSDE
jgi:hypothetical protein